MRFASRKKDFWELRSAEKSHRANPKSFWVPPLKDRKNLRVGQAARLIFDIESVDEEGHTTILGKRMWVIVSEREGDVFIGILSNKPASFEPSGDVYLCFGAEVPFKAEHVIDIADPPENFVKMQLGEPPERRWPRTYRQRRINAWARPRQKPFVLDNKAWPDAWRPVRRTER